MPSPLVAVPRFDLSLRYAEISAAANRRGYIGALVAPPVPVALQSGNFLRLPAEAFLAPIEDTRRGPRGSYRRGDYEWETDSYATEDHGVEEQLDDREVKRYGAILPAEMIAVQRGINRLLQAYENDVAAAMQDTTSTFTGASYTTGISTAWTTAASAVPITDIDGAIDKVYANCGSRPNCLILPWKAARAFIRTAQVQDLVKYGGFDDPKALIGAVSAIVRQLFEIENCFVARGFKNTAGLGNTTPTFTRLWDPTKVTVCCINDVVDLDQVEPCTFKTVMWTEENAALPGGEDGELNVIVEEYREEGSRSNVLRVRNDRQVKLIHKETAHVLTNATA